MFSFCFDVIFVSIKKKRILYASFPQQGGRGVKDWMLKKDNTSQGQLLFPSFIYIPSYFISNKLNKVLIKSMCDLHPNYLKCHFLVLLIVPKNLLLLLFLLHLQVQLAILWFFCLLWAILLLQWWLNFTFQHM